MKIKRLTKQKIKQVLQKSYGLSPSRLDYVDAGVGGMSYLFEEEGKKLIAKVHPREHWNAQRVKQQEAISRFLYSARHDYGIERFSHPMKNKRGTFLTKIEKDYLVVYFYLPGKVIKRKKTPKEMRSYGELLGMLHSIPPKRFRGLRVEKYDAAFDRELKSYFSKIEKSKLKTFAYLREHIPLIKESMNVSRVVRKKIKSYKKRVVTHFDLNPGNSIFHKGSPYLIDWDRTSLAPAEADILWFCKGLKINRDFERGYLSVRKGFRLNKDVLLYFKLQKTYLPLIAFSRRIFAGDVKPFYVDVIGKVLRDLESLMAEVKK